jgi:hypothetical protein
MSKKSQKHHEALSKVLGIHFTEAEYNELKQRAAQSGVSVSRYYRQILLNEGEESIPAKKISPERRYRLQLANRIVQMLKQYEVNPWDSSVSDESVHGTEMVLKRLISEADGDN